MSESSQGNLRKLVAVLACRNSGSRLFGKPLQNLDSARAVTVLDNIIQGLTIIESIDEIVLAIAEGPANLVFTDVAEAYGINYVVGDERDVLSRLILGARTTQATDVFRVTSESPFVHFEEIDRIWHKHVSDHNDATFLDEIVDGCGFEIVRTETLQSAHDRGDDRHRSELCTLYIREHEDEFQVARLAPQRNLVRRDLRLTVDNPEDLILCRAVYQEFKALAPHIPIRSIVGFLDSRPDLVGLCSQFTESGYESMYKRTI